MLPFDVTVRLLLLTLCELLNNGLTEEYHSRDKRKNKLGEHVEAVVSDGVENGTVLKERSEQLELLKVLEDNVA